MDKRLGLVDYLLHFIGRPYIWGGNGSGSTEGGFDCSGLVLEGLWAFGLYTGPDTTANGLKFFAEKNFKSCSASDMGAVVFFGANEKATHVAVCIGGGLMVEAGGAGSEAKTAQTSAGMVRVRPVKSRKGLMAAYMPNF